MEISYINILISILCIVAAAPQQPEINDQFEKTPKIQIETDKTIVNTNVIVSRNAKQTNITRRTNIKTETGVIEKIYKTITSPITAFITAPKVANVLRNIGTCIVNGAMEIVSYYFPAPLIPLIATAAGMIIPFEPVVMLKEKMPIMSYRRAFRTAVNTFLNTFDKYKIDEEDDPYMTRRFNRRFMNDQSAEIRNKRKTKNDE